MARCNTRHCIALTKQCVYRNASAGDNEVMIALCSADAATMDIVEMVLTGRVNKGLVSLIQMAGGQAVGLCGKDSNLLAARQLVEKDIGFVGEVTKVNNTLLQSLVDNSFIPVVSTVAVDSSTGQALNVNADTAAGEIASALQVPLFLSSYCALAILSAVSLCLALSVHSTESTYRRKCTMHAHNCPQGPFLSLLLTTLSGALCSRVVFGDKIATV